MTAEELYCKYLSGEPIKDNIYIRGVTIRPAEEDDEISQRVVGNSEGYIQRFTTDRKYIFHFDLI